MDEPLILLAFQDITERHILEKKLASESLMVYEQRQFLLDLFRDAPALLAIFKGPQHLCELANADFISHISSQDPVGKSIYELVSVENKTRFADHVNQVYATGQTYAENEVPLLRPGAPDIFLNLVIQAMTTSNGEIEGLFFFAIDATQQVNARKATEANLRTVLESLYQISWTSLPDGTINYFNRQFYQYTGLTENVALGQGWTAFVHPSQIESISHEWNEAIIHKKDFQQQLLLVDQRKNYRWHMVSSTRVTDDKGDIVFWIVSCSDIHDQKLFTAELEKLVAERTKELVKANTDLTQTIFLICTIKVSIER